MLFRSTAAAGGPITHMSIGTDVTGTGKIVYYGPIVPNITMAVDVIPRITTASTITED